MKKIIFIFLILLTLISFANAALPVGTVSYLPMNGTAGDSAWVDVMGHTVSGGAPANISATTYVFKNSTSLEGSGWYIYMADSSDWAFGTGNFSVGGWYYFKQSPTNWHTLWQSSTDANNAILVGYDSSNHMQIVSRDGGTYKVQIQGAITTPSINTWYWIVTQRTNNNFSVWQNGTQILSGTDADEMKDISANFEIGRSPFGGSSLKAFVDDFIIIKGGTANITQIPTTELEYAAPPVDSTPPASITNLTHTSVCNGINWSWTNPVGADYNGLMMYWDGAFSQNLTKDAVFHLTDGLQEETSYTFSTRTFDTLGNTNSTWVNSTNSTWSCATPTPTGTVIPLPACGNLTVGIQEKTDNYILWTWNTSQNITSVKVDGIEISGLDTSLGQYVLNDIKPNSYHHIKLTNLNDTGCSFTNSDIAQPLSSETFYESLNIWIVILLSLVFVVCAVILGIPFLAFIGTIVSLIGLLGSINNSFLAGLASLIMLVVTLFVGFTQLQ